MVGDGPGRRRVLIIGWGFIGSAIGRHLLARGATVGALTRSRTAHSDAALVAGANIVVGDPSQVELLDRALQDVTDVVFSVGGMSPPATAAHPGTAVVKALVPLVSVLEAVRQRPHVTLTYLSSGGTVYGNPARLPVRETDPTEPISPYGALHLACEDYAQMYSRRCGMRLQILRCANVYGPSQANSGDQGAVAIFLDRVSRGLPLQIFGDGSALRDYVFVDDVADVAARLIGGGVEAGVVNVGSGSGLTVLEIANAIGDVAGCRPVIEFVPDRGIDVRAVVLDISRLQSFIPYTPTVFAQGLRMTSMASRPLSTPTV
ncbi:MAG: NAD-dependent epimerase/dehydratase family protein [Candidatus Dormiibacterota bacterium]